MAFIYRFIDNNDRIIYVGYTGQQLDKRIAQHFEKGHLDPNCYKKICRIDYIKFDTMSDAQIYETFYINLYKPLYNKQNKRSDNVTVQLEEKEWKVYKQFKQVNPIRVKNTGWWRIIAFFYLIFIILYYVFN